ncbi:uncharacterized protein UV8b_07836 [Ustilaginoidea virens]|uniref:BRCT domain-containing protein n=1 Tax=Ustilaginoidea virens TaxID=1159556 RepID=A0A063BWC2_USTVR|nr:uncharacterized protein UV8b_07836 [Ustilaginoidea virens]QUC23595.1 hypothetical protein UV8b_07836 [Ustilaginoidea virens]GAO17060.1 hypothetical protein UVI_02003340 [Ustilaginoidea virens]
MASSPLVDDDAYSIDPSKPLRDVIVCCTSIPPDQRTEIAQKVDELGGIHKYDLTPEVTHLIVGDYETPKYRHVARERPDIRAMDAAWIEAIAELWKNDLELDFLSLEREHQLRALEKSGSEIASAHQEQSTGRQSLLICLTGFGEQRDDIAAKIVAHGGRYTGDLTRKCTHLIASKPEGKKFTAAKSWNIYTVTLDWLDKSIERGMILDESRFDPLLPVEEQGLGAWIKKDPRRASSLGKRSRSLASIVAEDKGARKLRKTASMKLNSQRDHLWGDILGHPGSGDDSFAAEQPSMEPHPHPHHALAEASSTRRQPEPFRHFEVTQKEGVFRGCVFAIQGFCQKRYTVLQDTITTLGGAVASSLQEVISGGAEADDFHRFLIVPQLSRPDSLPDASSRDGVETVTEFYIEKCLHGKQFFHPSEHVLGQPFPVFPIPGFAELVICSAAFTGLELSQIARSLTQLGAKFEEEFRRSTSVLVCRSLSAMRKDKLRYALEWGVPVVPADWLWECIATGSRVPLDKHIFAELRSRYQAKPSEAAEAAEDDDDDEKQKKQKKQNKGKQPSQVGGSSSGASDTRPTPAASKAKIIGGFDASDFDDFAPGPGKKSQPATPADSFPAKSRPPTATLAKAGTDDPLGEVSEARLNKSPPPAKRAANEAAAEKPAPSPEEAASASASASAPAAAEAARGTAASAAARQQSRASERQALSSKLSSLMHSAADCPAQDAARPRRRQILGRAISNASNASSAASLDGASGASGPRQLTDSLRAAVAAGLDDQDSLDSLAPPAATQLEYADPDAQQVKEAIMSRMMGGGV